MKADTKIPTNRTRAMRLETLLSVLTLLLVAHAREEGTPILKHVSHMTEKELNQHVRRVQLTPPVGTSTYHLTRLVADESRATSMLKNLVNVMFTTLDVTKRYLSSWEELEAAGVEAEGFASHPLHAYALTKHVSLGWPHVEASLRALSHLSQNVEWLLSRSEKHGVPTGEDLATVAGGLARLHDYYSLNLTALAHAQLVSAIDAHAVPVKISPTVVDLHRIGSEAVSHNVLNSGVDFLRAALDRWDGNASSIRSSDTFDAHRELRQIDLSFRRAVKIHDQVLEKKGPRSDLHSTYARPFNKTLARKKKYHKKEELVLGVKGSQRQGLKQYRRLCRGEDLRPVDMTSRLYCRYVTNGSPLYKIGPLRMDVRSLDPYVVTLEEVVTPSEAADLVLASAGYLTRSSTVRANGSSTEDFKRTSSTAWMLDKDIPFLPVLTQRIEQLVGVNAQLFDGAEIYQILNYGVGGHYTVHHDAFVYPRVATFLIYLSTVPQGGRTVFPWVGAGVQPKRGSALLWFNMDRSGKPDSRLQHGACPVLLGDKWVINKWLYYTGQQKTLPCIPGNPEATVSQPLS
ncbi:prolyl 4-hydroxylase subunit alpha-1-like [Penaeus monodon]|uniref:prolyl 4-hydroxylase subunit alpha-1-like n=1 Tax=Penaeus monodon TaxID=6687 RepID=UPI0018A6F557|nr:prolyl 4-hydroxylase subunit alpha-1-like [Penaeus monodon]XP_037778070.1 prolyl 4-hydroxylase subunit alpha-1-like [Penaeus monodon]